MTGQPRERYQAAAQALAAALSDATGFRVLLCAPGEQGAVAEAVAQALDPVGSELIMGSEWPAAESHRGASILTPKRLFLADQSHSAVVPGPFDANTVATLNSRRDWTSARGALVVLVLAPDDHLEFLRHAPDLLSTATPRPVPFEADRTVDPALARAELANWTRARYGRMDLRGFVRSEVEDVSWGIEEVYQTLRARDEHGEEDDVSEMVRAHRHTVLIGHPGSGKTFFLRWAALHALREPTAFGMTHPLAVVASLSAWQQAPKHPDLLTYLRDRLLADGLSAAHVLEAEAAEGNVLFLLDGLDEVGDEAARRDAVAGVRTLFELAPQCRVVVTSRVSGYADAPVRGTPVFVEAFSDVDVERFLRAWCILYARDRLGDTPEARRRGELEGAQLADDVRAHPEVRALAGNPLLLTVLTLVHRTGVRLPDHRVELYEHATKVLVERWNRVRGLTAETRRTPIKVADAVRLLGPVALDIVRSGARSSLPVGRLRTLLSRSIDSGSLRAIGSADEALALFKGELGLLVESAPGLYAFLHLTLAEYLAARELVRTGELEVLAANPAETFRPEWREVVLLAAGDLGVTRADDARLGALITTLIESAGRRRGRPSVHVPSLLSGLLEDDPGLTPGSANALVDELIPKWWFDRNYGLGATARVFWEGTRSLKRLQRGGHSARVNMALRLQFGAELTPATLENLAKASTTSYALHLLLRLRNAGCSGTGMLLQLVRRGHEAPTAARAWLTSQPGGARVELVVDPTLDTALRADPTQPNARVHFLLGKKLPRRRFVERPWGSLTRVSDEPDGLLRVAMTFEVDGFLRDQVVDVTVAPTHRPGS